MAEQDQNMMQDLTDVLQTGVLNNPSDTALYKAEDLKNGPVTITIRGFVKRQFTDKTTGKVENSWVLLSEEDGPGVKLNLTRQEQLFSLMGTNRIDEMVGRPITLEYDPDVKFGAKKVGGIRLSRAEDLAS